jgi:hypothetical protein
MSALTRPELVLVILAPLIAWRVYSRVRRMVGRQRLGRLRPRIQLAIFPALVLLLAWLSLPHPASVAWLAGGVATGALLALYGLRLTRFERTAQGYFYTPNAHLGIALSLLFIGRIVYRLIQVYAGDGPPAAPPGDFASSPATLAIFGTLAGYYISYAIGLVRWRRKFGRRSAPQ